MLYSLSRHEKQTEQKQNRNAHINPKQNKIVDKRIYKNKTTTNTTNNKNKQYNQTNNKKS